MTLVLAQMEDLVEGVVIFLRVKIDKSWFALLLVILRKELNFFDDNKLLEELF